MGQKKGIVQTIYQINSTIGERVGNKRSKRSLKVTGAACIANTFVGIGKLVMGILSLSLSTCVSAFYTFGMVFAKSCAIAGIFKATNKKEQYRYYVLSGIILIAVSVFYILYSVRLFFYPETASYHMYVGMGIATFTFTELALNIRGVIIERHNHTPLIHAIKMINLASSLICLALTQTALLSFADTKSPVVQSQANGLIGVIMGCVATIIGVAMIIRIKLIQNDKYYAVAFKKVRKLAKKQNLPLHMKPVRYTENDDENKILYVKFLNKPSQGNIQKLQRAVKEQLKLELDDAEK